MFRLVYKLFLEWFVCTMDSALKVTRSRVTNRSQNICGKNSIMKYILQGLFMDGHIGNLF
jgi:hypothetical protein